MTTNLLESIYDKTLPLVDLSKGLLLHIAQLADPENADTTLALEPTEALQLAKIFSRDLEQVTALVESGLSSSLEEKSEESPSTKPIPTDIPTVSSTPLRDESDELRQKLSTLKLTEQKQQVQIELLASKCAAQEDQIQELTGKLHVALDQARVWDSLHSSSDSPRNSLRAAYAVLERTHEETGILEQRHKEEIAQLLNDVDQRIMSVNEAAMKREDALVDEIQRLDEKLRSMKEKVADMRRQKMEAQRDLTAEKRLREAALLDKDKEYRTLIKNLKLLILNWHWRMRGY
ncbi:hypothetical protein GEMRC1_007306 [Eukaryota sp. GEM-RC1]